MVNRGGGGPIVWCNTWQDGKGRDMTQLNERMRPEGKKTKQKHLHSWRISLGEKKQLKTFHAVLLLVTQSASSKRPQAGDLGGVGGALTSAGFLSRHRGMEGQREGIKPVWDTDGGERMDSRSEQYHKN